MNPEPPVVRQLDFSRAHFLDHSVWHCFWWHTIWRCCHHEATYGGARIHVAYWWQYRAGPGLAAATRCRVGWHPYGGPWYKRAQPGGPVEYQGLCCGACYRHLPEDGKYRKWLKGA